MGGGHGADSPVMQEAEYCYGKGSSLRRIRSRSQFVKKTQGIFIRPVKNVYYTLHVGREGRKALFNALLVTDIRIYFGKYRKLRKVSRGHVETRLTHEGKKAHGL